MAKEINPNLGKDGVFKSTDRDNSVFKEVEIKPVSPIKKHRLLSIFKRSFGDKVAPEIPQQSDPTSDKLPPLDHKTSVHISVDELKSEVAAPTRLDDAKKLTEKDLINNDLKEVFSKAGSNIQSVTHELIDGSKNIGITVIKTGHLTGSSVTRKYVLTDAGLHKVLEGKEGWEYERRTNDKNLGIKISDLNKCIVRPRIWSILKLEDEKERLRELTDFTLENYFSKNRLADCFNTYEIEEIAAILAKDGVEKTNLTEGSLFQELAIEADSLLTNLEEKEAEHLKRTEATITDLFNEAKSTMSGFNINNQPVNLDKLSGSDLGIDLDDINGIKFRDNKLELKVKRRSKFFVIRRFNSFLGDKTVLLNKDGFEPGYSSSRIKAPCKLYLTIEKHCKKNTFEDILLMLEAFEKEKELLPTHKTFITDTFFKTFNNVEGIKFFNDAIGDRSTPLFDLIRAIIDQAAKEKMLECEARLKEKVIDSLKSHITALMNGNSVNMIWDEILFESDIVRQRMNNNQHVEFETLRDNRYTKLAENFAAKAKNNQLVSFLSNEFKVIDEGLQSLIMDCKELGMFTEDKLRMILLTEINHLLEMFSFSIQGDNGIQVNEAGMKSFYEYVFGSNKTIEYDKSRAPISEYHKAMIQMFEANNLG